MYTHIETHAFTYTCTYAHAHACMHTQACEHTHSYTHVCIHTYTQTHTPLMVEISVVSLHQVPSIIDNIACGYKLSVVEIKKGMLGLALWHHFDTQEEET